MEAGRQRQFHIHHCLGRGGYGEVYRATMVAPGGIENDVAVKLLRVDLDPGAEAVRRLRDEGRLLSVLRHPAILRVFDLALLDGRIGLVTEFVDGEDLSTLVGVLPLRATLEVIGAVAEALDAAWNHPRVDGRPLRLVHRDIKPSNIRIGRHGEVKVLDFGIARSMDEQADRLSRTGTGSTVGSLAYMAPERFARSPSTPAGDVYGLGCALYECLSGFRLFDDPVPVEMFRLAADERQYQQHLDKAMVRLDPTLEPDLLALLRGMLAYAPSARPSPAEIEASCAALTERLPGPSLRTWARERVWPARSFVPGHLEGRIITEGTLSSTESGNIAQDDRPSDTVRIELMTGGVEEPPAAPSKEALAPVRRMPRAPMLALCGLTLLALGGLASQIYPEDEKGPDPVLVAPAPAPVAPAPVAPAPAPVLPAVVLPAPVVPVPVAPEPVEIESIPEPAPVESVPVAPPQAPKRPQPERGGPAPVAPAPVPPEPEIETVLPEPIELPVPEVRYGRVVVIPNNVRVELHGPDRFYPPGRVPVGRYELFADFGYGTTNIGRYVDVLDGYETTVRCNTLRHQCDVDR